MKIAPVSFPRSLLILVGLVLVGGFSISIVTARQTSSPDGRINEVAYFGGDALYCVDSQYFMTNDYDTMIGGGGFRLLDKRGQELWFASAADIAKALQQAFSSEMPALAASGEGSYGESALYVNKSSGGGAIFIYTGFDEHGKLNSLTFNSCVPRGGAVIGGAQSPDAQPPVGTPEVTSFGT
jgi:hypothetical protein